MFIIFIVISAVICLAGWVVNADENPFWQKLGRFLIYFGGVFLGIAFCLQLPC